MWRRWRLWAWLSGPPPANHEAWRRRRRRQLRRSPPANNPCHRATTRCPLWASPGAGRPLSRGARRRRKQRPPRPTTRASSPCYRAWRRCRLCASPPSTPAAARLLSRRRVPPRWSGPASSRCPALGLVPPMQRTCSSGRLGQRRYWVRRCRWTPPAPWLGQLCRPIVWWLGQGYGRSGHHGRSRPGAPNSRWWRPVGPGFGGFRGGTGGALCTETSAGP